jgi:NAD kinase
MLFQQAIIVRDKTRLELLVEKFNTKEQAKFYLTCSGLDFGIYETEHETFYRALANLKTSLSVFRRQKELDRSFLPTYIFAPQDMIFVLGRDGLVANVAKYVNGQPIIAINPDPETYDGPLLPFTTSSVKEIIPNAVAGNFLTTPVTMAKAHFSNGQTLLAFNDFFIGQRTHTSARYSLSFKQHKENQSSSGIIVSTGAGSSGWMSSVFNMVSHISSYYFYQQGQTFCEQMDWDCNKLLFAVREPFRSQTSSLDTAFGEITEENDLLIESHMAENGVVFSDGMEKDAFSFNAGTKVRIKIAKEKAILVRK